VLGEVVAFCVVADTRWCLSQTHFVVGIVELADHFDLAVFLEDRDAGETHAVEGRVLHHGVVRHVLKDNLVSDLKGFVEAVIADEVTGETGRGTETIGVGFLFKLAAILNVGAIGHLKNVGHVSGRGNVEDSDVDSVFEEVDDAADEDAGAGGNCFAGLKVDLEMRVAGLDFANDADEAGDVVVLRSDEVTSAEVEPLHALEVRVKLGDDVGEGALKGVGSLLAEGVKVKAFDPDEIVFVHVLGEDAEAGAGGAGIVDFGDGLGILRIDPEAGRNRTLSGEDFFAVAGPLAEGVKDDVIGDLKELRHFLRRVSGGKDVDFAAEFFGAESCLVEPAGGGSGEIVPEGGVKVEAGEGLLREEDFGTGFLLDMLEDQAVPVEGGVVHEVAGGLESGGGSGVGKTGKGLSDGARESVGARGSVGAGHGEVGR